MKHTKLPYRPGVGMVILNYKRMIFIAKRTDKKSEYWQMPQGGIHLGETPSKAALREMSEELGCCDNQGRIIAETRKWYSYDIPVELIPKLWNGQFRGQRQKWFLIKFTGDDQDINLDTAEPEFVQWRWAYKREIPRVIVPFKRQLYKDVLHEFRLK